MLFKTNKQRGAYWRKLHKQHTEKEIKAALATLKKDTARVLIMHYQAGFTLTRISSILEKSGTVVRQHHNRGIFQLWRYFKTRRKLLTAKTFLLKSI